MCSIRLVGTDEIDEVFGGRCTGQFGVLWP